MRWLSPPDSVAEPRDSVRYSSPTLERNPSRSLISFRIERAISRLFGGSVADSEPNQPTASAIDISATWLM